MKQDLFYIKVMFHELISSILLYSHSCLIVWQNVH